MPPASRTDGVVDDYFGTKIVDNYRWLEGDNTDKANMGKVTPEVAAWTDAQNAYTRSVLDSLPGRDKVEARLRSLMEVGAISLPRMTGGASEKEGQKGRYFYSKREGSENQARVFVREGFAGQPRLLLDPNTLDDKGLVTVSWYSPSNDGKLLAYGTYRAGDENATLNILDVDSGKKLATTIPNKVQGADWLPDNTGFVYRNLADPKNPYSGQVMFRRLVGGSNGTAPNANDTLIIRQFTEAENKALATTYGPDGGLSKDGRWGVISYSTDTRNNDLWAFDFPAFVRSGEVKRIDIMVGDKSQNSASIVGDTLFLTTTCNASNGRVIAIDLKNPAKDGPGWKEIIPTRKDAVIESVSVARGILAVQYMVNACNTIELFDFNGKPTGTLRLPGIGSAGLSTDQDRTEAFLSFTSFNYPTSIFRVDLAKPDAEPQLWERPEVPVDPSSVEVKQEWYSSKDGVRVPIFIVHKKGLKLDGNNPTILNGYGGFNVSETPFFSAGLFQWFESGGVFALPNLRGGGEFGEAWHNAGKLANKQNVFNDFIAAGEFLIQRGYTNSKRLAISGGSNGGLLTGACLTQRPDLFGAVIVAVPLLDMLRFQNFLMAKYWVPEYGSAENKDQFEYLGKYSPYQNVKKGTKYPAVLLTAGENDSRVHALHARKMAASLQACSGSDLAAKPILLWVDREAGHGQGKPLSLRVRDAADQRMFLMWQLGMLDGAAKNN
jgi:prolyl oligopeptidase